jgi:hypothetical protein
MKLLIDILKQSIIEAKEELGRISQPHIDHIYKEVYQYIRGEDGEKKKREKIEGGTEPENPGGATKDISMQGPKTYSKQIRGSCPNM